MAYDRLDPDLMKRLARCVDQMPPEDRSDLTGRTLGLLRFLDDLPDQQADRKARRRGRRGSHTQDLASIVTSFDVRMRALAALRDVPEFGAWWIRTAKSGNPDMLHEVMIETAAMEPLIEGGDWPSFDPTSFLRHALRRVEADGRA
jgi:hypothetical protein